MEKVNLIVAICYQDLIGVIVQLSFTHFENEHVIPVLNVTAAPETTAFEFLQLAAQQNPCYLSEYLTYPRLGRYITTICCVTQNLTSNFYWFLYINNTLSPVGVDFLKPNNGDVLRFEYRSINSHENRTETSQTGMSNEINEGMCRDRKPFQTLKFDFSLKMRAFFKDWSRSTVEYTKAL